MPHLQCIKARKNIYNTLSTNEGNKNSLWPWNMKLVLPRCQLFWSKPKSVVSIRTFDPCLYTLYVSLGHIRETRGTENRKQELQFSSKKLSYTTTKEVHLFHTWLNYKDFRPISFCVVLCFMWYIKKILL